MPSRTPEEGTDASRPPTATGGPPPAPRWVKVALVATAAVVLLLLVIALATGGEHGPGRHAAGAGERSTSVQAGEPR